MTDAWYKIVPPHKEVQQGCSFHPDEFAIALEQVVAGTTPEDHRDPALFFAPTCWTRPLREQAVHIPLSPNRHYVYMRSTRPHSEFRSAAWSSPVYLE